MVTVQRSKNCELLDCFCTEEQVLSLTQVLNRLWSHALKPRHHKAQDLLYEPQVPRYYYSPGIVGIKSLPAILPIVTYLIQPFWSIKSGALSWKAQRMPCVPLSINRWCGQTLCHRTHVHCMIRHQGQPRPRLD